MVRSPKVEAAGDLDSATSTNAETASPSTAPMVDSNNASPSTMRRTRGLEKPSVFMTPISLVRSRIADTRVVETIIRIAAKAAATTIVTMKFRSPACFRNAWPKVFSSTVEVS